MTKYTGFGHLNQLGKFVGDKRVFPNYKNVTSFVYWCKHGTQFNESGCRYH